jgi:FkbM family methyltransferase
MRVAARFDIPKSCNLMTHWRGFHSKILEPSSSGGAARALQTTNPSAISCGKLGLSYTAAMTDLIFSAASRFTSVKEPYATDKFVAQNFKDGGSAGSAAKDYEEFLDTRRPLLTALLHGIAEANGASPIRVVDCGVFMGSFGITVALQARKIGLSVDITAFEANSALIRPIQENYSIYGVNASLHAFGIGGKRETVEFVYPTDGLIGGTAFNVDNKKHVDFVSSACEIIPLKEALSASPLAGLVKLDIEGNEVAAFLSIADDEARLNNVFIIEFAEYQAQRKFGETTFGSFLLSQFDIFDVSNWLWVPFVRRIADMDSLSSVKDTKSNRAHNTDLVLVPKSMAGVSSQLAAMVA